VQGGVLTRDDVEELFSEVRQRIEAAAADDGDAHDSYTGNVETELGRRWRYYRTGGPRDLVDTRFGADELRALLERANRVPDGFTPHRKITRLLTQRQRRVRGELPVDWALAEQAAFATLVSRGHPVRLSGQDCGRGTFSHRHAVLTDIKTGEDWVPLAHLCTEQSTFEVYDSLLSEAAVLGFEYGYTLDAPDHLVIWEAQFGDFANGAQVIIDNFIISGEQKWNRCSGLVMLLPHGYEGQGPEHSSARLERYLQLCAEDNMTVANCTTPANFFHLLRRHTIRRMRRPLVVMSPKSLLRHPDCISTMDELSAGGFRPVLADDEVTSARRVLLCSGRVAYDLRAARAERGITDVAIVHPGAALPAAP